MMLRSACFIVCLLFTLGAFAQNANVGGGNNAANVVAPPPPPTTTPVITPTGGNAVNNAAAAANNTPQNGNSNGKIKSKTVLIGF